jgi:hypothetical protein
LLYARIIGATGWTWEYVAEYMTLPRLYALSSYWRTCPPVQESVAALLGVKPEEAAAQLPESVAKTAPRRIEMPR